MKRVILCKLMVAIVLISFPALLYANKKPIQKAKLLNKIYSVQIPFIENKGQVENDKVKAARVILPVTEKLDLPPEYGLRHRAGLGISEVTDSLVIIVSEENGQISLSENGILQKNVSPKLLKQKLEEDFP